MKTSVVLRRFLEHVVTQPSTQCRMAFPSRVWKLVCRQSTVRPGSSPYDSTGIERGDRDGRIQSGPGRYDERVTETMQLVYGEGFFSRAVAKRSAASLPVLNSTNAKYSTSAAGSAGPAVALVRDAGAARVVGIDVQQPMIDHAVNACAQQVCWIGSNCAGSTRPVSLRRRLLRRCLCDRGDLPHCRALAVSRRVSPDASPWWLPGWHRLFTAPADASSRRAFETWQRELEERGLDFHFIALETFERQLSALGFEPMIEDTSQAVCDEAKTTLGTYPRPVTCTGRRNHRWVRLPAASLQVARRASAPSKARAWSTAASARVWFPFDQHEYETEPCGCSGRASGSHTKKNEEYSALTEKQKPNNLPDVAQAPAEEQTFSCAPPPWQQPLLDKTRRQRASVDPRTDPARTLWPYQCTSGRRRRRFDTRATRSIAPSASAHSTWCTVSASSGGHRRPPS